MKNIIITVIILVILVGMGYFGYIFFEQKNAPEIINTSTPNSNNESWMDRPSSPPALPE